MTTLFPIWRKQPTEIKSRAAPAHKRQEVNVPHGFDMRSKLHALSACHSRQNAQWALKPVGFRRYVKILSHKNRSAPSSFIHLFYIILHFLKALQKLQRRDQGINSPFCNNKTQSLSSGVEVFGQTPNKTGYQQMVLGLYWIMALLQVIMKSNISCDLRSCSQAETYTGPHSITSQ